MAKERTTKGLSAQSRERQMISLAEKLARRQLEEGTASAQVITHYLKLGSQREKLEISRLKEENKLLRAKTNKVESEKNAGIMYEKAIKAMRSYAGLRDDDEYEDEDI